MQDLSNQNVWDTYLRDNNLPLGSQAPTQQQLQEFNGDAFRIRMYASAKTWESRLRRVSEISMEYACFLRRNGDI